MRWLSTVSVFALIVGANASFVAYAATVDVTFSGFLTESFESEGIYAGDPISGRWRYDPDLAISTVGTGVTYSFPKNASEIQVAVGGNTYTLSNNVTAEVINNEIFTPGDPPSDLMIIRADDAGAQGETARNGIAFFANSIDDSLLKSSALPRNLSDLNFSNSYNYGLINSTIAGSGVNYYLAFSVEPESIMFTPKDDAELAKTVIYLDFDSGVGTSLVRTEIGGTPYFIEKPFGETAAAFGFSDVDKRAIADRIAELYATAGMLVTVVTNDDADAGQKLASATNKYTIEFGEGLPGQIIHGLAYDVSSISIPNLRGFDQFDSRKDGTVAVFVDPSIVAASYPGIDPLNIIADVAAHELGHGFGLRHIDAGPNLGEILDYDVRDTIISKFYDKPVPIVSKFSQSGVALSYDNVTHNPTYHLLANAEGVSSVTLMERGLTPGTYDTDNYTIAKFKAAFKFLTGAGSLYLSSSAAEASSFGGTDDLLDVTGYLSDGLLDFAVSSDESISFFGSSGAGNVIDLILGRRDSFDAAQTFTIEDLQQGGFGFFSRDESLAGWQFMSDVDFQLIDAATFGPTGEISPVPLPSSGFLLSSILLLFSTLFIKAAKKRNNVYKNC